MKSRSSVCVWLAAVGYFGTVSSASQQTSGQTSEKSAASQETGGRTASATVDVTTLNVPTALAFKDQMEHHIRILAILSRASAVASKDKGDAEKANSVQRYKAAEADQDNVKKALVPYGYALAKARGLILQGYMLKDMSGQICRVASCVPVEAITAVFFYRASAKPAGKKAGLAHPLYVMDDHEPQHCPEDRSCNMCINNVNACTIIPDATYELIHAISDDLVPPNDHGANREFLGDPEKTTLEGIQNLGEYMLSNNDTGELRKLIGDPIKCSVGRLFKNCPRRFTIGHLEFDTNPTGK